MLPFTRGLAVFLAAALAACSSVRQSQPPRTATEQLLISKAADEAARELDLPLPSGARVFFDVSNFDAIDGKYAIGAIKEHLLRAGARLAFERAEADVVVEIRSGAAAIDESEMLIGTPRYDVPIPFGESFTLPKIALFDIIERKGVAKFAATAYDARSGELIAATGPRFGYSHVRVWTALVLLTMRSDDLIPEDQREPPIDLFSGP